MKILHVITSLHTGGAETLVVNLMPRFRSLGHDVGVVVFNGQRTALMERLERECPECKVYKLGNAYYSPSYIPKLWRIMRQYDIVHTHNSSPQLFAAIANLFCRKKLVTTEHSTSNRKREQGGVLRLIDKWMYRHYHKVICISEIAEKTLTGYLGVTASNICTINNGVDVDAFHNANPVEKLKCGRFSVVMVAGFREAKDQDTLIRAIGRLSKEDYELWLVGDGVRRSELEALVNDLKLEDQVRFYGLRTDVANILQAADVVVMSSHWEGLSLSNIEGMSVGKPFVASDVKGLHEITEGSGLLFPHGDDKALADLIRRLHDDQLLYKQVADACYEKARQFDICKMVEKYNEVYQELNMAIQIV